VKLATAVFLLASAVACASECTPSRTHLADTQWPQQQRLNTPDKKSTPHQVWSGVCDHLLSAIYHETCFIGFSTENIEPIFRFASCNKIRPQSLGNGSRSHNETPEKQWRESWLRGTRCYSSLKIREWTTWCSWSSRPVQSQPNPPKTATVPQATHAD